MAFSEGIFRVLCTFYTTLILCWYGIHEVRGLPGVVGWLSNPSSLFLYTHPKGAQAS
jgi:hypothetical protein